MTASISPWMSAELLELRDLAAKFFSTELAPHAQRFADQHQVDRELWHKAGELGLLCMSIPEEYGGEAAHSRTKPSYSKSKPESGTAHGAQGCTAESSRTTSSSMRPKNYGGSGCPKMASGEMIGAIAMTEPGTGSDLQSVKTKAILDGDEYVITGAKTFITNGQQADLIIVVAKTDPSQAPPASR